MFGTQGTKWKVMTLMGHPIYVQPFFLLLLAFFVFRGIQSMDDLLMQATIAPALFFSIIWHEMGHALTTEKFGYGKSTIVLHGLGGVAINRNGSHAVPKRSLVISAAGPFATIVLALIFGAIYAFAPLGGIAKQFVLYMVWINAVLAIFNLLPINPLDGGHMVLHGLRWAWNNERKALLWSAYTSVAVLAIAGAGLLVFTQFGILLIIILALLGYQNVQIIQKLKGAR